MKTFLQRLHRDERGVTALETAIILIAFVVVASVFAFTILSSGTSSTQQAKDAIAGGLAQVSGSLQVRGSVIAEADAAGAASVGSVTFTISTVTGGSPVDLTQPCEAATCEEEEERKNTLIVDYRDAEISVTDIPWTVDWVGYNNDDDILQDRELAEITVDLSELEGVDLGPNGTFTIELKPPTGGTVPITRTMPPSLDKVMDLG